MQKNGAGLHTASSAWWDNTTDGETAQYRASQAPAPASECATAQGAAPSGVTTRRCIASHPCLACRCRWQTRALHPFIVAGRCCCVQSFSSRVPSVRRDAGLVKETRTHSSSYRRAATTERRTSSITPPTLPRYLDRRGGGIVVIAYRDSRPSTIISYLNRVY